jgi:hypothetical protein
MTAPELEIPAGFFDEIAAMLDTETAEEISDAVITVCTRRGILYPELDEDPADELRTEQIREVFGLLGAVTAAVSDGTIVPSLVFPDEELDPRLAALWSGFVSDAVDPQSAAGVEQMIRTGDPVNDSLHCGQLTTGGAHV